MAADIERTPFVKQLGSSDRPTRDKALESLRKYLLSNRTFTDLELLQLWKGLFYSMWHSDRPIPQQNLARSLASLILPLQRSIFIPFLRAFWQTISREWNNLDALRMDKFLYLIRCYVNNTFVYLNTQKWDEELLDEYLDLVREFPLSKTNMKVGDGLRYHVLDVWVDELDKVDSKRDGDVPVEKVMAPVRELEKGGHSKKVRERARECAEDVRLVDWKDEKGNADGNGDQKDATDDAGEEEWGGIED